MNGKKSNPNQNALPFANDFLLYQTEDGQTRIEVRLQDESVWLTQSTLTELFQTSKQNISLHLKNIFAEGELSEDRVVKKYLTVRSEGQRDVKRLLDHYNLDMIISVGYRVKSHVATRFRIWATQTLREYVVKGFVLDDERLKNPDQPFDYFDELIRRIPMAMADWIKKLDAFMNLNSTLSDYMIHFFQDRHSGRDCRTNPPGANWHLPHRGAGQESPA